MLSMKRIAIGLVLLAASTGLSRNTAAQSDEEGLRVMSYNIRYLNNRDGDDVWPNRRDAVFETIRQADVVGLQEVVLEQFEQIRAATPEMQWYGVGRDDGQQAGEMTAIGWRTDRCKVTNKGTFWLSDTPNEVGSRGWDAALPRVASWIEFTDSRQGMELLLVNTHFDHVGLAARLQSAKLLRTWIAKNRGDRPAILTGDLNATEDQPPLQMLLKSSDVDAQPLTDARAVTQTPDEGPTGTWNGFKQISEGRRIDYIAIVGDLQVTKYRTLDPRTAEDRFASDHLPLMATFVAPSKKQ